MKHGTLESMEGTNELFSGMKYRAQRQSHTCMEHRCMKEMACQISGERKVCSVNGGGKNGYPYGKQSRTLTKISTAEGLKCQNNCNTLSMKYEQISIRSWGGKAFLKEDNKTYTDQNKMLMNLPTLKIRTLFIKTHLK